MKPVLALVLQSSEEGTNPVVEVWDIQKGLLCNPRPPASDDLKAIAKACVGDKHNTSLNGYIPPGTIYVNDKTMLFMHPAERTTIFLESKKGTEEIELFLPRTLFLYTGPLHNVSAYWTRSTDAQVLGGTFKAIGCPLPNINKDGGVCMGSALRDKPYTSKMDDMQNAVIEGFLRSTFNEWRHEDIAKVIPILQEPGMTERKFWKKAWPLLKWRKELTINQLR